MASKIKQVDTSFRLLQMQIINVSSFYHYYLPFDVVISTSTVGLPRLSKISRAQILLTPDISSVKQKTYVRKRMLSNAKKRKNLILVHVCQSPCAGTGKMHKPRLNRCCLYKFNAMRPTRVWKEIFRNFIPFSKMNAWLQTSCMEIQCISMKNCLQNSLCANISGFKIFIFIWVSHLIFTYGGCDKFYFSLNSC